MKDKFIVAFEGIDGVGKTTISKLLVESIGYIYDTSYSAIDSYKTITKRDEHVASLSFGYYLDNISSNTNECHSDIMVYDRCLLSALGYYCLRTNREPTIREIISLEERYQPADVTFVLSVKENIRRNRIFSKQYIDKYDIDSLSQKNSNYWVKFYNLAILGDVYYIDTNKNIHALLNEIQSILKSYEILPNKANKIDHNARR